jgi:hypothetical protein
MPHRLLAIVIRSLANGQRMLFRSSPFLLAALSLFAESGARLSRQMRNSPLWPRSLRCFLNVPFCSGSLFSGCNNLTDLDLPNRIFCALRVTPASQRRRFRVRAAFFAAAERERAERCLATRFACLDNARLDADLRLSRLSARFVARERFREGFLRRPARPFVRSRFAWRFVCCLPRFGGGNFTPARRALDRPMAIACSGDRAPCSPSRMCSISSRTNSPA